MHGFTKALALEVARKGITVNTISPGYIGTKMVTSIPKDVLDSKIIPQIPMGRLGKPEEVAHLALYLASDRLSGWVTGTTIHVDGGALAAGAWMRLPEDMGWTHLPVIVSDGYARRS